MGNFDELGFKIVSDEKSYQATVQHLQDIENRLNRINELQNGTSTNRTTTSGTTGTTTGGTVKRPRKKATSGGEDDEAKKSELKKYKERVARQTELLKDGAYKEVRANELINQATQKRITSEILLTDKKVRSATVEAQGLQMKANATVQSELLQNSAYKEARALELLNEANRKKLTYDTLANNADVRKATVQATIAQTTANVAVQTDLLASAEYRNALAQQATNRYQERQITQMATLRAEQQALNNGKYEETRRLELANQKRKKEIDQRLKLSLGLKDNTKSLTSYLAKMTSVIMIARRLAQFVTSAVNESAKYIESLNLFAVSFGESYKEQIDWALGISKAYGLANEEVIKFAGTFRELATSLGVVGQTADTVTKIVTNLGYDLSALFNTSVETAMEKIQSGVFSGNVRPLRSFGIDISQNQIDALFETNEALASLGVNARNLSQADKVIARLIITLNSGRDSFGTMAREINNLQSQFRIFQGSVENLKLALGDALEPMVRGILVFVNAAIIALTDLIRILVPLQTTDETPKAITNITEGAEEAEDAINNLQGKLAGFDKFNVLQSSGSENSNLAVTEELNRLLEEQARLYEEDLSNAMAQMTNEATELAAKIKDVVLYLAIFSGTSFITAIVTSFTVIKAAAVKLGISFKELGIGTKLLNSALISGIVWAVIKMVEAFKEGDTASGILYAALAISLVAALIAVNIKMKQTNDMASIVSNALRGIGKGALFAVSAIGMLASGIILLARSDMDNSQKMVSIFIALGAAITAAAIAMAAFKQNWVKALSIAGMVAGGALTISSTLNGSIDGFADGGYSNANLIMTHENGKREWVGKAAGSNAIVNDTQMGDIMEMAVAKGVYNALSARSAMGGSQSTNETIVVKIGEEAVFNAVKKTAKKQGMGFANI